MNKSLSTRLMYSFMAIIVIVVVGITAGTSYLIADYFFKIKEEELSQKGREMADTVEYFVTNENNRYMLMRYLIAVDRLVGARIWLFDDDYNLLAASNIAADVDAVGNLTTVQGEPKLHKPDVAAPANQIPVYEYTTRLAEEIKHGQVSHNVNNILKDIYRGGMVHSQIYHPYFKQQVILVGVPYGDKNHPKGAILMAELWRFSAQCLYLYHYCGDYRPDHQSFYGTPFVPAGSETSGFYERCYDCHRRGELFPQGRGKRGRRSGRAGQCHQSPQF